MFYSVHNAIIVLTNKITGVSNEIQIDYTHKMYEGFLSYSDFGQTKFERSIQISFSAVVQDITTGFTDRRFFITITNYSSDDNLINTSFL